MANVNAPNGFDQTGNFAGDGGTNFSLIKAIVDKGDSTAIGRGDPVKRLSTGYVARWTASTAVSQMAGIFWGCKYRSVALGRVVWNNYWPGSDAAEDVEVQLIPCNLATPPQFIVQSSGTAIGFADIGSNADVSMGTVNTTTGRSGASLDQATINTTATLPFRIVGLLSDVAAPGVNGTDNTASYNRVIVAANVSGAGSTGI